MIAGSLPITTGVVEMRYRLLASMLSASLAFASPVAAQKPPPQPEAGSDIVVTGTRDRDRDRQVSSFVNALTKAPVGGQISRFEETVCPAAIGLTPRQNEIVAARLRTVAKAVGLKVGEEGCKPNVSVIVAQDRDAMVRDIRSKWTDPLGDRVKVPNQPGPAVALHVEGLLDADGIPAGVKQDEGDGRSGFYTVELGQTSSRLRPASRPHFLGSILVVEPVALDGLTTVQLADYAAMRLLARTDPSRLDKSASTILTLLDAPMNSAVPVTLTQWDFAFLKALYGSSPGTFANRQRNEMRHIVGKELDKARKAEEQ